MDGWVVTSLTSLLFLVYSCQSAQTSQPKISKEKCSNIVNKFQSISLSSRQKIYDGQQNICDAGQSCCTPAMKTVLRHQALDDFHSLLKKSGAPIRSSMSSHVQFYYDHFVGLVRHAEIKTRLEMRAISAGDDWLIPLTRLYANFTDALKSNTNIAERIDNFFFSVFPDTLISISGNTNAKQPTLEYRNCLKHKLSAMQPKPFHDHTRKISMLLDAALSPVRSFIKALQLAMDSIETAEKFTLSESCVNALTRLTYCSQCSGYVSVQPCEGLCLNVLRGCLVELRGMEHHYSEFTNALHRAASNLHTHRTLEKEMVLLPSRISHALLPSVNTSRVHYQMVQRCGKQGGGGGGGARRREAGLQPEAEPVAIPLLTAQRLEALADTLGAIRHLTLHLADTVCKTQLTPDHHGDQHTSCWNGTSLAPYVHHVADNTVSEQLHHNPEVSLTAFTQSAHIVSVKQQLSLITKELNQAGERRRMRVYGMQNDAPTDDEDVGSAAGEYDDDVSGSGVEEAGVVVVPEADAQYPISDLSFTMTKTHRPLSGRVTVSPGPRQPDSKSSSSAVTNVTWLLPLTCILHLLVTRLCSQL